MPRGTALLLIRIGEVPAAIEEAWNRWYNGDHMPARLAQPGFLGARRFRAYEGECRYLMLYELESVDALRSASYLRLRQHQSSSPQYLTVYDLADKQAVECGQFLKDRESPWSAWVRSWFTRRLRIKARRISPLLSDRPAAA